MGAYSLGRPEESLSLEPIRRKMGGLRARTDGNAAKFAKAKKSLPRLEQRVESAPTPDQRHVAMSIFRSRMERVLSLSTTRLRVAPETRNMLDYFTYDLTRSTERYEQQERSWAVQDSRSLSASDLDEIREGIRRERLMDIIGKRSIEKYESSRRTTESSDVANMTASDVAEIRIAQARDRAAERMARRMHIESELARDEQLEKAEQFAGELDERAVTRSLTDEPNGNVTYIAHWWEFVGDDR